MAADIVPELYKKIQNDYQGAKTKNRTIAAFNKKLEAKKATSKDVFLYATELGECASFALCNNLKEDTLPDGKLYWNIAERTIKELLKEIYEEVNNKAEEVQRLEDEKQEINLNPIRPDFPTYRVNDLLNKLISILEEGTDEQ